MPRRRGIRRDQEASVQALAPSAPPPGTRKETAPRAKERGTGKQTSTLATGQGRAAGAQGSLLGARVWGSADTPVAGGGEVTVACFF